MNFLTTIQTAAQTATATLTTDVNALSPEDRKAMQALLGTKTDSVSTLEKAGAANALMAVDATFKAFKLEAASKRAQLEIVLYAREQGWTADGFCAAFKSALTAAGMTPKSAANRTSEARRVMTFKGDLPSSTDSLQLMAKAIGALVGTDAPRTPRTPEQPKGKGKGKGTTGSAPAKDSGAGIVAGGDVLADHMASLKGQVAWLQSYVKPSETEALDLIASLIDVIADLEDALATPEGDADQAAQG